MNMKISSLPLELHCLTIQIMSVKAKDETIFTGTRLWHLKICYEWLHRSKKTTKNASKKELRKNNAMAMDTILDGLHDPVKVKIGQCTSAKELWDILQENYKKEAMQE